MPMKLSRCLETEEQGTMFLSGFINIVNPLNEHNRANYWSLQWNQRVRSTRSYEGDRRSCRPCDICRVLNSGLGGRGNERTNNKMMPTGTYIWSFGEDPRKSARSATNSHTSSETPSAKKSESMDWSATHENCCRYEW